MINAGKVVVATCTGAVSTAFGYTFAVLINVVCSPVVSVSKRTTKYLLVTCSSLVSVIRQIIGGSGETNTIHRVSVRVRSGTFDVEITG